MTLEELLNTPIDNVRTGGTLIHYASEYYDPQKAHEYYMEHRKLKGRSGSGSDSSSSSSSGNNETPKTDANASSGSKQGSYEEEYERYSFEVNKKISLLQRRLGRMSKEARMLMQDEIYAEIDKLREENMNKKYELKAKYGKGSGGSSGSSSELSAKTSEAYKAKWG